MRKFIYLALALLMLSTVITGCEVMYHPQRDRSYNSGHDADDHDRGRGHEKERKHRD